MIIGRWQFRVTVPRSTFRSRLPFVWRHRRCCGLRDLLAVLFGRAQGLIHRDDDGFAFMVSWPSSPPRTEVPYSERHR